MICKKCNQKERPDPFCGTCAGIGYTEGVTIREQLIQWKAEHELPNKNNPEYNFGYVRAINNVLTLLRKAKHIDLKDYWYIDDMVNEEDMTPIERFILNNQPADNQEAERFREQLSDVLNHIYLLKYDINHP